MEHAYSSYSRPSSSAAGSASALDGGATSGGVGGSGGALQQYRKQSRKTAHHIRSPLAGGGGAGSDGRTEAPVIRLNDFTKGIVTIALQFITSFHVVSYVVTCLGQNLKFRCITRSYVHISARN